MAWKNIKDHFRIEHIVQLADDGKIHIGSGYCPSLIIVSPDGKATWGGLGPSHNDNLARYFAEMTADPAKVRDLIAAPDTFTASLPVYTYRGAEILERHCEAHGWPNVTHDGHVMYENTHFADKAAAVKAAKSNAAAGIELYQRQVADCRSELSKFEALQRQCETELSLLERDYPVPSTPEAVHENEDHR